MGTYRPGHSTHLQLNYLTHNLYEVLDAGQELTAIFFDISKYFDKIWHEGLLGEVLEGVRTLAFSRM